jgi:hypothetical protein
MTTFISVSEIARNEQAIAGLKESRKGLTSEVNTKKIESYALLVADLNAQGVRLTNKGKLPTNVSKALKADLIEAGVSDACIKRYVENTTGVIRAVDELSGLTNVGDVLMVFDSEGLTTEAKIKARAFGDEDAVAKLAKAVAKLDESDRIRLDELVRAILEAKEIEAEKEAQANANAASIAATLEALEAAA